MSCCQLQPHSSIQIKIISRGRPSVELVGTFFFRDRTTTSHPPQPPDARHRGGRRRRRDQAHRLHQVGRLLHGRRVPVGAAQQGPQVRTICLPHYARDRLRSPSTQVGACIVSPENKIVGIGAPAIVGRGGRGRGSLPSSSAAAAGYNGMPVGCPDDEMPWARHAASPLDTKYPYVCHAELNAIVNKNAASAAGCTMSVKHARVDRHRLTPTDRCIKLRGAVPLQRVRQADYPERPPLCRVHVGQVPRARRVCRLAPHAGHGRRQVPVRVAPRMPCRRRFWHHYSCVCFCARGFTPGEQPICTHAKAHRR